MCRQTIGVDRKNEWVNAEQTWGHELKKKNPLHKFIKFTFVFMCVAFSYYATHCMVDLFFIIIILSLSLSILSSVDVESLYLMLGRFFCIYGSTILQIWWHYQIVLTASFIHKNVKLYVSSTFGTLFSKKNISPIFFIAHLISCYFRLYQRFCLQFPTLSNIRSNFNFFFQKKKETISSMLNFLHIDSKCLNMHFVWKPDEFKRA